jgi:hypothetical protein
MSTEPTPLFSKGHLSRDAPQHLPEQTHPIASHAGATSSPRRTGSRDYSSFTDSTVIVSPFTSPLTFTRR